MKQHKVKKSSIIIVSVVSVIFLISLLVYWFYPKDINEKYQINNSLYEKVKVILIVDGDTFVVDDKNKSYVRLICVDAPEQGKEGYYEAKNYLSSLILNKTIFMERDTSNRDKYYRLLRYVYLEDGLFVNKELVRQGYASIWRYGNDTKRCGEIEGK